MYLYRGFPTGEAAADVDAVARVVGEDDSSSHSPRGVYSVGDLDGDGADELGVVFDLGGYTDVTLYMGPDVTGTIGRTDDDLYGWVYTGPIAAAGYEEGSSNGAAVVVADTDSGGGMDLVSIYEFTGSSLSRFDYLYGDKDNDWFGHGLAGGIGNDVNGDGFDDIFIGAPEEDRSSSGHGAVYVLEAPYSSGDILDVSLLVAGDKTCWDFGWLVAAPGDVNGDGQPDMLVNAYGGAGAVYLMENVDFDDAAADSTVADAAAAITGASSSDNLGKYPVATGDVDGDGELDILLGTLSADSGQGAAWLIYGPLEGPYDLGDAYGYDATFVGDGTTDWCGASVALGDLDADGLDDVMVGCAYGDTATVADHGLVSFFPGG